MKQIRWSLALIVTQVAAVTLWAGSIQPTDSRHKREVLSSTGAAYTFTVQGKLDSTNCITRTYAQHLYAFHTDDMLAIENRGTATIINPRVSINGYRTPRNIDELLDLMLQGENDPQEKIYRIWDFVRTYRHHDYPLYEDDELHDPVKYMLIYGGGFCDDSGSVASSLFHRAGFTESAVGKDPLVRCLHGHMMSEVYFDGDYQFMDSDENAFYLDRDNQSPVSGNTVVNDHDLVHRELHYGPQFSGWETSRNAASLFGRDDETTTRIVSGHVMDLALRPGERIEYLWNYVAGYAASRPDVERRNWNNSRSFYRPLLVANQEQTPFTTLENVTVDVLGGASRIKIEAERTARIGFPIALPYLITGATLALALDTTGPLDWEVVTHVEDRETKVVGSGTLDAGQTIICPLSEGLWLKDNLPLYRYGIKIRIHTKTAPVSLKNIEISTDFLANPLLFPSLKSGKNKVVYEDDSALVRRDVLIEHRWDENKTVEPIAPPNDPIAPKNDETVMSSLLPFRWQKVEGATAYHLLVSTSPECMRPYRTSYDVIVSDTEYEVPFTGMFSPGRPYYWKLRAQDENGVWSEWSNIKSFQWQGPCVPVNLRTEAIGGDLVLHWDANPRGERPVRYKVYGSDIQGFSISDGTYTVESLGDVGPNLLSETTDTHSTVVTHHPIHPNQNKVFYRVVAIDESGVESGCSDAIELPHPLIVSNPPDEMFVGKRIEYAVQTLRSTGDLQYRYETPNRGFWEVESFTFSLLDAPVWLTISDTGIISGIPPQTGPVKCKVFVESNSGETAEQFIEWSVKDSP